MEVQFTRSTEWRSCLRSLSNSFLCLFGTRYIALEDDVSSRFTDEYTLVGSKQWIVCNAQMGGKATLSSSWFLSYPRPKTVSVIVSVLR